MPPEVNIQPHSVPLPPSPPNTVRDALKSSDLSESPRTLSPRPQNPRRASSPEYVTPTSNTLSVTLPYRPRNRSPLSRGHTRSQSGSNTSPAPPMQRARSSPGFDSVGRIGNSTYSTMRPSSPLGPSGRRRSPLRSTTEETYPGNGAWDRIALEPNIPEHAELDTSSTLRPTATNGAELDGGQLSPLPAYSNTFPRARRRPSSPLQHLSSASLPGLPSTPTSSSSSPLLSAQKYANEPYPGFNSYPSLSSISSMPSTPSSLRSRSPSISSLETIPDTPDAEEAARLEAEDLAQLRAAVNGEDGEGKEPIELRRRSSMEMRGFGFGNRNKQKRWSVCGAERRQDLDLETIWED